MPLQKAIALPSISLLPPADPRFRRAIEDVTLLAGGLIASVDAALLTIAVPSDRWGNGLPLLAWTQRLAASAALSRLLIDTPMFAPALDALFMGADTVFDRLEAWRWNGVASPGLCLVTDGVGAVLSTRRPPADADCAWLLDLARAGGDMTMICSPNAHGAWSLIAAEARTLQ